MKKEIKTYQDIEELAHHTAFSFIGIPENVSIRVDLEEEDFKNLVFELGRFCNFKEPLRMKEITIMTTAGIKVYINLKS